MRVVIASHGYSEVERVKLLEAIAEQHDVTLLVPDRIWAQVFGDMYAPESTEKVRVIPNRTLPFGAHYLFRPSWQVYRDLRPDVLHVEYDPWTPEFWSVVLPMLLLHRRIPIVLYTKKNTRHVPRGPLGLVERLLTRLGMSRVSLVLAASLKAASIFRDLGYGDTEIKVQGHIPIDEALFRPVPVRAVHEPRFEVGFVGSIAPHKGVRTLVSAVAQLRDRLDADVRLSFVGPMRDESLAALLADYDWISYLGPRPNSDIPAFLSGLDAFVMPSAILPDHEEHDGQALLEAMAMELACVGSRGGIIPELIEDGHNGLLFEAGDVSGLVDALEKLVADGDLRRRFGTHARGTALARTGLASLASQRLAVYDRVLAAQQQLESRVA
ncbi:glycosyltransferase family 4 protein [Jatrophihabitans sp.]|uniref:glycosyltransferase family 4 protein n=1 Tax=Jatrophihabitans sp. TaxID=1932789 RepID=UPI0030C685F0|nr:putative glycosyltransferase [Jatrophihabitans sp.]